MMQWNPRALVVDDDTSLLRTICLILRHKGYNVATAEEGYGAISLARGTPFDLIIMDVRMPGMDGVECYEKLREIQPKAAVVLMTAYTVDDRIEQARRVGVLDILRKPLDMDRVFSLLEDLRLSVGKAAPSEEGSARGEGTSVHFDRRR